EPDHSGCSTEAIRVKNNRGEGIGSEGRIPDDLERTGRRAADDAAIGAELHVRYPILRAGESGYEQVGAALHRRAIGGAGELNVGSADGIIDDDWNGNGFGPPALVVGGDGGEGVGA